MYHQYKSSTPLSQQNDDSSDMILAIKCHWSRFLASHHSHGSKNFRFSIGFLIAKYLQNNHNLPFVLFSSPTGRTRLTRLTGRTRGTGGTFQWPKLFYVFFPSNRGYIVSVKVVSDFCFWPRSARVFIFFTPLY